MSSERSVEPTRGWLTASAAGRLVAPALLVLLLAVPARACGPWFPNRIGDDGEAGVLQAPVGIFEEELGRLVASAAGAVHWRDSDDSVTPEDRTASADMSDLRWALAADQFMLTKDEEGVLAQYRAVRQALRSGTALPPLPGGLPAEFACYARGAIAWGACDTNAATAAWRELLELPSEQRRFRSTWAAYMLGRVALDRGCTEEAIRCFQHVRALRQTGCWDSLDLETASLGWEARAELDRGRIDGAMERYLEQVGRGEASATVSLRWMARDLWDEPARMASLMTNTVVRRVLTAYALSHVAACPGWEEDRSPLGWRPFLAAVEAAGVTDAEEADRLAWAAYRAGDYSMAERWVRLAPASSIIAHLVEAKLLLRKGRVKDGMAKLRSVVSAFPEAATLNAPELPDGCYAESWDLASEPIGRRARGELGLLHLSRGEYAQALDLLLRGGYWEDAAYVAERVLTVEELRRYVDATWPLADEVGLLAWLAADWSPDPGSPSARIRYLLGRRMVRAGEYGEAAYLPGPLRPLLQRLAEALQTGENTDAPIQQRALALWKAACLTRYKGMELMGTELDPDWSVYRGSYDLGSYGADRAEQDAGPLVHPGGRELSRGKQSVCIPNRRYHYRSKAGDLAWRAAGMMVDDSDETAQVLVVAGGWLQAAHPEEADRFYKALVRRCGRTALGKQAEVLHWFPPLDVKPEQLLAP